MTLVAKVAYDEKDRVETGPVQFGEEDWPGLFIRGDECIYYMLNLENGIQRLNELNDGTVEHTLMISALSNLRELLEEPLIKPTG